MTLWSKIRNKLLRKLYYRNPLNVYLGKKIYKNNSGMLANVIGNYVLKRDRSRSNICMKLTDKDHDQLDFLGKNGWVDFGKIYSDEEIRPIKERLDEVYSEESLPDSYRFEKSSQSGNIGFYNQFPDVKSLINEKLISFISFFYQSHLQVINVHIYRTFSIPEDAIKKPGFEAYGSTEFWHNDGTTVESLKLFVLLDKVGDETGPLHIISLDDSKDIIGNGFSKYVEGRSKGPIESTKNVTKLTGEMGTALLANPNTCLHRSDVPAEGRHRDMLVFYISCNDTPLVSEWEKDATRHQYLGFSRLFN